MDVNSALMTGFAGIGAAGVIVNWPTARHGWRAATLRQDQVLAELTEILLKDLADKDLTLVTAAHVHGMAYALTQQHRSPELSGKVMTEAVRATALETYNRYTGKPRERRLIVLNNVLKELDPKGPTLLSIATVDQVTAYVRSQPIAVGCLFVAVTGTAIAGASLHSAPIMAVAGFLLAAEALLLWGAVRALHFWASDRPFRTIPVVDSFRQAAMNPPPGFSPVQEMLFLFKGRRHRSLVIFLYYLWVAIWEGLIMGGSSSVARLFGAHSVEGPGGVRSSAEHGGVRNRRVWRFALRHEFRVDQARPLVRELLQLQRERDLAQIEGRPPPNDRDAFSALCRRLWVITGDEVFRRLLEAGEIPAAEYANPVLRYL
jgi:hypothetical protein